MRIIIKCECGNEIDLSAPPKKYLQLRDNLETRRFRYGGEKIKNAKLQEIQICCDECGNWIDLGMD